MDMKQKMVLGILVVSIFIFLITILVFAYEIAPSLIAMPPIFAPLYTYHVPFMVLMGIFGVLSGFFVFSMTRQTIEKQKKVMKTNLDIIMKFLSTEDRAVMKLLLERDGMTTQSEIAKVLGISRLRAHRVVRKLLDRGVIHVEKHGKINMLRLVAELKEQN